MVWLIILVSLLFCLLSLLFLYLLGKYVAVQDKLEKVDAIVCLAGTRGNISILHERIETAVNLLSKELANVIIMSGAFSEKIDERYKPIHRNKINKYIKEGRITGNYFEIASNYWDVGLGSKYMEQYAINMGTNKDKIIIENTSLHSRENAKYTLKILKKHGWKSIILVTSPFHQRRAYLSFKEILLKHQIKIINYAAISDKWNPYTWYFSINNIRLVLTEIKRIVRYFYT